MEQTQTGQRTYEERTVTGEVEVIAQTGSGFKLNGEWVNYGDFYQGVRPERGQTVEAVVKGKFLRRLRVLTPGALDELEGATGDRMPWDDDETFGRDDAPARGSAAPRPVRQAAPVPAAKASGKATLRAAALAAAAHFLSGKADSTEDAVYETASRFLAWIEDGD